MSYTEKITCPRCGEAVELEVETRYDESDDVEIKPIIREEAKMVEYTKEDWKLEGLSIGVFGRGIIAQCPTPQDGGVLEVVANARLVAQAPRLYEACKEANEFLYGANIPYSEEKAKVKRKLIEAIAEVEGGKHQNIRIPDKKEEATDGINKEDH